MVGLPVAEKQFEDMFTHFDTVDNHDRQTDIQIDTGPYVPYAMLCVWQCVAISNNVLTH